MSFISERCQIWKHRKQIKFIWNMPKLYAAKHWFWQGCQVHKEEQLKCIISCAPKDVVAGNFLIQSLADKPGEWWEEAEKRFVLHARHWNPVQSAVLEPACNFWCYSFSEFEWTVENTYEMMRWLLKMPLYPSPRGMDPSEFSEGNMKVDCSIYVCYWRKKWTTTLVSWTDKMECPELLLGSQITGFAGCSWA